MSYSQPPSFGGDPWRPATPEQPADQPADTSELTGSGADQAFADSVFSEQPTSGQPAAGQPAYGPPPYGVAQPGQRQYPWAGQLGATATMPGQRASVPYPSAPYRVLNPTEAGRRDHPVLVAVAALVTAVVVLGGASLWRNQQQRHASVEASPVHVIALPATFDRFTLLTDPGSVQTAGMLRNSMVSESTTMHNPFQRARIGIYDPGSGRGRVIALAMSTTDDPLLGTELNKDQPSGTVHSILDGANATGIAFFDAGPLGGKLGCGKLRTTVACAWGDLSTVVLVVDAVDSSTKTAAATALKLRNAAEH